MEEEKFSLLLRNFVETGTFSPEFRKAITDRKEKLKQENASKSKQPSNDFNLDEFRARNAYVSKLKKQRTANTFGKNFILTSGPFNKDTRICIWPGDSRQFQVDSSGITWVAVHGKTSICFVSKKKRDMDRADGSFLKKFKPSWLLLYNYMEPVVYQMEDRSLEGLDQSIDRPFGIVSGIPSVNKMNEEVSCDVYDEKAAVDFLKKKFKKKMSCLTKEDTIQTALLAFQLLCRKKFKGSELMVGILGEEDLYASNLMVLSVKKYLAAIKRVSKTKKVKLAEAEAPKAEAEAPKAKEAEAPKVERVKLKEAEAEAPKAERVKLKEAEAEAPKAKKVKLKEAEAEAPKAEAEEVKLKEAEAPKAEEEAMVVSLPDKGKAKKKQLGKVKETGNRSDTFMNEFYPETEPMYLTLPKGLKEQDQEKVVFKL